MNVPLDYIDYAFKRVRLAMEERREQKGYNPYPDEHAILGSLTEEVHELLHEIHQKDTDGAYRELIDIAVAALFGMASISTNRERKAYE